VPWIAWIVLMACAALLASTDQVSALKSTARLAVIGLTAWMVATSVTSARRMAGVLATAALTGMIVAAVAALEVWRFPAVAAPLAVFRDGVRVVGGEMRASSTLQYPTIAAMYLELVLCGSLGALLWTGERRGWRLAWAGILVVVILALGLAVTLTRAAIVAALAGLLLAAWWRYRGAGADRGVALVAACAIGVVGAPLVASPSETALARWSTEGRHGWYRAAFRAPEMIAGPPGSLVDVPITVTNLGRITWSSSAAAPFFLSYHLVEAHTTRVIHFEGLRTPLNGDVAPNSSRSFVMKVRVPFDTGDYRLAWDVLQEHRLWFGAEPGAAHSFTRVSVRGEPAAGAVRPPPASGSRPTELPQPVSRPGRLALWGAAVRLTADHPWIGVGPDNFRSRSGAYLAGFAADSRVHSNNMYLEVLTGGGVVATAAFLWFLWRVIGVARAAHRRLTGAAAAAYTGVAAAGTAFLCHGLLDSFLTFTPTAFAAAVVLGLAVAPCWWTEAA
jgi:hypothetical protein